MIGFIALVGGLSGMLGLWIWAWRIWLKAQAAVQPASSSGTSNWRNEPTHDLPSQQSPPEFAEVPVMRTRSNSDANTEFFSRRIERTEILLQDEDILEAPKQAEKAPPLADPPPTTSTRRTKFYTGRSPRAR